MKQARAKVNREDLNKMGAQFAARMLPGGGESSGSAMQVRQFR